MPGPLARLEVIDSQPVDVMCPTCQTWAMRRYTYTLDSGARTTLHTITVCRRCQPDALRIQWREGGA